MSHCNQISVSKTNDLLNFESLIKLIFKLIQTQIPYPKPVVDTIHFDPISLNVLSPNETYFELGQRIKIKIEDIRKSVWVHVEMIDDRNYSFALSSYRAISREK